MNFKKTFRIIHLWLGLASGLIIVILGITGCIYAFINEIVPIVYQDKLFVKQAADNPLPIAQLIDIAQEKWGPEKPVSTVEIYTDKNRAVHFRAFKENTESGMWYWDEKEYYESIFLNPYTGELISHENSEFDFFRIVLYLHWSLLLNTVIGKPIVGMATLIFTLSLISGLILWWPKNKQAKKARYWFRWKNSTGWKRKVFDLHNIPGFYALFFALIFALTGLFWAFEWVGKSAKWLANSGNTYTPLPQVLSDSTLLARQNPFPLVLESAGRQYPDAVAYTFYFPRTPVSPINIVIRKEPSSASVTQQYDQYSGDLLRTLRYEDKNPGEKLEELNYDIHVGSIGGLAGKLLAFVISFICATLPISGFLIWYNRHWGKKKRKSRQGVPSTDSKTAFGLRASNR